MKLDAQDMYFDSIAIRGYFRQVDFRIDNPAGPWSFQKSTGKFTFENPDKTLDVQVLGIEVQGNDLWRWAWDDKECDFAEHTLESSRAIKSFGEEKGLHQLVEGECSLPESGGQYFGLLGAAITSSVYCPVEITSGLILYLLAPEVESKLYSDDLILLHLPQALSSCAISSHRSAVDSFMKDQEFTIVKKSENNIVFQRPSETNSFSLEFDAYERLTQINYSET